MSSAYAYAEGGPASGELQLRWALEDYGVQAVYGRVLSFHEIRMISLANNVVNAYQERAVSGNWAEWAENNKDKARILNEAGRLAEQDNNG